MVFHFIWNFSRIVNVFETDPKVPSILTLFKCHETGMLWHEMLPRDKKTESTRNVSIWNASPRNDSEPNREGCELTADFELTEFLPQ